MPKLQDRGYGLVQYHLSDHNDETVTFPRVFAERLLRLLPARSENCSHDQYQAVVDLIRANTNLFIWLD